MPNDESLAISADQFAALQPDSQAALRSQLLSAGYSQEQLAAKFGGGEPSTKTPATLPDFGNGLKVSSDPALAPSFSPTSGVAYESKIDAFRKLQAAGVDGATLAAAAKAEGINLSDLQITEPAPAERVSLQEANERLAATSTPDAPSLAPSDFRFTFDPAHIDGLPPDEVRDINDMFATAWHQARVPLQHGQPLLRAAMDAESRFADMDEAQRTLAFRAEGARLQRMGNANEIAANAEYAWSKLPANFQQVAAEHFLFHSAEAYAALGNAGQAMRQREAHQKK